MRLRHPMPAKFFVISFSAILTLALPLIAAAQAKIAFQSNRDGNFEIYAMNPDGSNQMRLTNSLSSEFFPSFSPDGSKIVFTSDRDGNNEIYIMSADGSNQVRLTTNSLFDFNPVFSPNGDKIAFVRDEGGGDFEIYLMNPDGSNQTPLSNNPAFDSDPAFSPDGTKIAFTSDRDAVSNKEIYLMNVDGTNPTRLVFNGFTDSSPTFSPDGTKIAFASNRFGNFEIHVMNVNGTNVARLTDNTSFDGKPTFDPASGFIVFESDRDGNSELYSMDAFGANLLRLTNNGAADHEPTWGANPLTALPRISNVVATNTDEGGNTTLSGDIFSANANLDLSLTVNWGDGTEQSFNYPAGTLSFSETHQYLDNLFDLPYPVNVTLSTANGSDAESALAAVFNVAPTLSVTQPLPIVIGSSFLLNGMVIDPGTLDTHTVNINWGDGSPVTTLNLSAGVTDFEANHTYSALGSYSINVSASDDDFGSAAPVNVLVGVVPPPTLGKIAFTSNFGGNNNIWLMNSNGTNQVALTTNPASDSYPDFSSDGSKIVFVSDRDGNPEIYTMNAAGSFQTRLTNNAATESEPVFSPDGSRIVFSSNRDGNHEIYIMNADGSGQTRLTTNTLDDGQAEFSPDGTKIIFGRLAANQSDAHIYTMDLIGANQTPLTSGSFVLNGHPSYSPDSQKIVFSRVSIAHTNPEIYTMNANGTGAIRLTTAAGQDMEPVFSPDGSKIAFRSERDGNAEIYIMDSDGTDQNRITFDGSPASNFAPSWAVVPTINVDIPDDLAREQGAMLTVPIIVTDTTGKGIISYDFTLNYDPEVLQPQTVAFDKTGTLSAGFEVNGGAGTPGRLVISGFGTAPLTGAGTLLNLKFNVIGMPPTSSDLILNPFVFNEGIPFVEVSAGRVFVQGTIRGAILYGTSATTLGVPDVDLFAGGSPNTSTTTGTDGTYVLGGFGPGSYTVTPSKSGDVNGITALDASLVSQFLVGAAVLTANQQTAGEVSGNGTLTSFDAALIAQFVVGLPNSGTIGVWSFLPPSRIYANVGNLTGENYTAILMGEVSGNWASTFAASLRNLRSTESTLSLERELRRRPAVMTATLPSLKVRMGNVFTIPISLNFAAQASAVHAYQFDLMYDPQVLQLEAAPVDTSGTLSSGLAHVTNGLEPGRLRLAVYGTNSINTSGTLINLKFRVIGGIGTSSELTFNGLMLNEGNPSVKGIEGKVTVRR